MLALSCCLFVFSFAASCPSRRIRVLAVVEMYRKCVKSSTIFCGWHQRLAFQRWIDTQLSGHGFSCFLCVNLARWYTVFTSSERIHSLLLVVLEVVAFFFLFHSNAWKDNGAMLPRGILEQTWDAVVHSETAEHFLFAFSLHHNHTFCQSVFQ